MIGKHGDVNAMLLKFMEEKQVSEEHSGEVNFSEMLWPVWAR